tara:strand:- start:358 stop:957 length:600 start_codon:yes stop_codon:yes gene_type:complete
MNDMTKVNDLTFIRTYENLASDEYCDKMIEAWERIYANSSLRDYGLNGIVSNNGTENRKDFALFFCEARNNTQDLQKETNMILDEGLKKYSSEFPSLEMKQYYSHRIKVQRTPPKGGFHIWHCEHDVGEASNRLLTWTIYLNDLPDGEGETEFLEYGIKIKPKKGSVCFFPSSFTHTHRGNPVYTHNKYIATGWYYFAQ